MPAADRALNLNDCVTPIFWANYAALHYCPEKLILNNGGGGSSKTTSLCQLFATVLMLDPSFKNQRLVIARESMPALKRSTMLESISVLRNWGLYSEKDHNKTDHVIRGQNGNTLQFMAMEDMDPDKVKSMNISMLFLDEATQISGHTFKVARMYVGRNANDVGKVFLGYNPTDSGCYIAQELERNQAAWKAMVIHSTYKDNRFLHPDKAAELEALADQDPNFYRVYCLGLWGSFEGLIYREGMNYRVVDSVESLRGSALKVYGLDAGYHNPFLVECGVVGDEYYCREIISDHELRPDQIIDRMEAMGVSHGDYIIADAADRNTIETIHAAGYNVHPSKKGADSVSHGIASVKKNAGRSPMKASNCSNRYAATATSATRTGRRSMSRSNGTITGPTPCGTPMRASSASLHPRSVRPLLLAAA